MIWRRISDFFNNLLTTMIIVVCVINVRPLWIAGQWGVSIVFSVCALGFLVNHIGWAFMLHNLDKDIREIRAREATQKAITVCTDS